MMEKHTTSNDADLIQAANTSALWIDKYKLAQRKNLSANTQIFAGSMALMWRDIHDILAQG